MNMVFGLQTGYYVVGCLAILGFAFSFGSRMTQRQYNNGGFVCRKIENLLAQIGIKIAHPAGAQSLFGGSQAKVFGGNGYINVAMGLVVGFSPPLFVVTNRNDYVAGSRDEPFALITGREAAAHVGCGDYIKMPGLEIYGRGGKTGTIEHIAQRFFADGLGGVTAY